MWTTSNCLSQVESNIHVVFSQNDSTFDLTISKGIKLSIYKVTSSIGIKLNELRSAFSFQIVVGVFHLFSFVAFFV